MCTFQFVFVLIDQEDSFRLLNKTSTHSNSSKSVKEFYITIKSVFRGVANLLLILKVNLKFNNQLKTIGELVWCVDLTKSIF